MQKKSTYTKRELAELYGISIDTLRKWIKPIEEQNSDLKRRKVLTPKEVMQIFALLGEPLNE
jgi:transposase